MKQTLKRNYIMRKQIQDRLNTYTADQVWNIVQKLAENPEASTDHSEMVFELAIDNLHDRLDPEQFIRLMNKVEKIQNA
jgi:hypothetical protein